MPTSPGYCQKNYRPNMIPDQERVYPQGNYSYPQDYRPNMIPDQERVYPQGNYSYPQDYRPNMIPDQDRVYPQGNYPYPQDYRPNMIPDKDRVSGTPAENGGPTNVLRQPAAAAEENALIATHRLKKEKADALPYRLTIPEQAMPNSVSTVSEKTKRTAPIKLHELPNPTPPRDNKLGLSKEPSSPHQLSRKALQTIKTGSDMPFRTRGAWSQQSEISSHSPDVHSGTGNDTAQDKGGDLSHIIDTRKLKNGDDIQAGNKSGPDSDYVDFRSSAKRSAASKKSRPKRAASSRLQKQRATRTSYTKRKRPLTSDSEDNEKAPTIVNYTRAARKKRGEVLDTSPYDHLDHFKDDIPAGWYVKNRNPRIKTFSDLSTDDITTFVYPIEVEIRRGQFVELNTLEDLREFMDERGLVLTSESIDSTSSTMQGGADPSLTSGSPSTFSMVDEQSISTGSKSASLSVLTGFESSSDDAQLFRKTIRSTSHDEILEQSSHVDLTNAATTEERRPQPNMMATLQRQLLAEVEEHTLYSTNVLHSGCDDEQERELLAEFARKIQLSVDLYNLELRQFERRSISIQSLRESRKSTATIVSKALGAGTTLTCMGAPGLDQKFRTSFGPVGSPSTVIPAQNDLIEILGSSSEDLGTGENLVGEKIRAAKKHTVLTRGGGETGTTSDDNPLSAVVSNRFIRPSTGHPTCGFCKKIPVKPRVTSCNHTVCLFCFTDALDMAYEKGYQHPKCPYCRSFITKTTKPKE